jgi:tetratricopeptide (TPR) repeat protein
MRDMKLLRALAASFICGLMVSSFAADPARILLEFDWDESIIWNSVVMKDEAQLAKEVAAAARQTPKPEVALSVHRKVTDYTHVGRALELLERHGFKPVFQSVDTQALARVYTPGSTSPSSVTEGTKLVEKALKLQGEGKHDQALAAATEALEFAERGDADPFLAAMIARVMGTSFDKQGKFEQAEMAYKNAIRLGEKSGGPDHSFVVMTLGSLADLYLTKDRVAEAIPLLLRAIRIQEKSSGQKPASHARNLSNLGIAYANHGRRAKGEEYLRLSLTASEQSLGANAPFTATIRQELESLARQNSAARGQHKVPANRRDAVAHLKAFTTLPQVMERTCAASQSEFAVANATALANWKMVNADLLLEIERGVSEFAPGDAGTKQIELEKNAEERMRTQHQADPKAAREICRTLAGRLMDGSLDAELKFPGHVAMLSGGAAN